jgi:hypothetical protein
VLPGAVGGDVVRDVDVARGQERDMAAAALDAGACGQQLAGFGRTTSRNFRRAAETGPQVSSPFLFARSFWYQGLEGKSSRALMNSASADNNGVPGA